VLLSGSSEVFPPARVLEFLARVSATGTLKLRTDEGNGRIALEEGRVVGAALGVRHGLDAFDALLGARSQDFTFELDVSGERGIDADMPALIERAEAITAEFAAIRARIPSDRHRFALSPRAQAGEAFTVTTPQLIVLRAVNGQRDVARLAQISELDRRTTLRQLDALAQEGVIDVLAPPERKPRAPRARRPEGADPRVVAMGAVGAAAQGVVTEHAARTEDITAEVAPSEIPVSREPDASAPASGAKPPAASADEREQLIRAAFAMVETPLPTGPAQQDRVSVVFRVPDEIREALLAPAAGPPAAASDPGPKTSVFVSHYLPTDATVVGLETPPVAPRPSGLRGLLSGLLKREGARPSVDALASPIALAALVNAFVDQVSGPAPQGDLAGTLARRGATPGSLKLANGRFVLEGIPVRGDTALASLLIGLLAEIHRGAGSVHGDEFTRASLRRAVHAAWEQDDRLVDDVIRAIEPGRAVTLGRLTIRTGGSGGPFDLVDRPHVIGRSSSCDVVLHDASVSRRHAEIRPSRGTFRIKDLGSSTGTSVNGKTVKDEVPLERGDEIRLGGVVLVFEPA